MPKHITRQGIFFTIFALSTLLTLVILYGDMNSLASYFYILAYALFLITFLLYALFKLIIQLTRLDRTQLRLRLQTFSIYFILFIIINFALDFVIPSADNSFFNSLMIAFGLAVGITFFDLMFKKT